MVFKMSKFSRCENCHFLILRCFSLQSKKNKSPFVNHLLEHCFSLNHAKIKMCSSYLWFIRYHLFSVRCDNSTNDVPCLLNGSFPASFYLFHLFSSVNCKKLCNFYRWLDLYQVIWSRKQSFNQLCENHCQLLIIMFCQQVLIQLHKNLQ